MFLTMDSQNLATRATTKSRHGKRRATRATPLQAAGTRNTIVKTPADSVAAAAPPFQAEVTGLHGNEEKKGFPQPSLHKEK